MSSQNHNGNSTNTSIENQNNQKKHPFSPVGLRAGDLYALEDACQLLRLGKTRYLEIRRNYVNKGIIKTGNAYLCYGRDLMKILIPDTAPDE